MKYVSFQWVPPRTLTFAKRELSLTGESADRSAEIGVRDWPQRAITPARGTGKSPPPVRRRGTGMSAPWRD
jgi:hypothetical protein